MNPLTTKCNKPFITENSRVWRSGPLSLEIFHDLKKRVIFLLLVLKHVLHFFEIGQGITRCQFLRATSSRTPSTTSPSSPFSSWSRDRGLPMALHPKIENRLIKHQTNKTKINRVSLLMRQLIYIPYTQIFTITPYAL